MLYIGNGQLFQYLFMVAVSFALGFALTYMFGYEDEAEVATNARHIERAWSNSCNWYVPAALPR